MASTGKWKSACIITIGNELLKGRTVNTNFTEIAKMLTDHGVEVTSGMIVMDTPESIGDAIRRALQTADVIITSGGLGPTFDDMTLASIGKALGLRIVENQEAIRMLSTKFRIMKVEMTEARRKMAMLPEGSEALQNSVGSAPGMLLKYDGKIIVSLPGVPAEMRSMLSAVIPSVIGRDFYYFDRSIVFPGIMESQLAPFVSEIMNRPGNEAYIKTHPLQKEDKNPGIEVEVSARTDSLKLSMDIVERILEEIQQIVKKIRTSS